MHALLLSFGVIFVAELGDKSQLMALAFAARYKALPILVGITAATALVHAFSVLVGAMACYLALSRRNELVVARAAGMSAWQFVAPALIVAFVLGIAATVIYNPLSAAMREWSKKLEADMFGEQTNMMQQQNALGFWVRQRSPDGQSIVYASSSQEQGVRLDGVSVFTFDPAGKELERHAIESRAKYLRGKLTWPWARYQLSTPALSPFNTNSGDFEFLEDDRIRHLFGDPTTVGHVM